MSGVVDTRIERSDSFTVGSFLISIKSDFI